MRKIILISFIVFISIVVKAQQIGAFNHGFFKPMIYNPAFTGSTGFGNAMLVSRAQWSGFNNAPQLNVFILDGNFKNKNIGLGIGLISDKKGITSRVGGNLSYSYRIKLDDDTRLLFGVSAGVINYTIDYSKVIVESKEDPGLFSNSQNQFTYDGSAGFAVIWKTLELGASVPQIAGNTIKFKSDSSTSSYTLDRHYIGYLKYKVYLAQEKGIALTPQILTRIVHNSPFQFDGTVNLDWNDKIWIGATYKSNYALAANIGFRIRKQFYVGYSYDFVIGKIGKYAGMSHEILLNFKFGKNEKPEGGSEVENNIGLEKENKPEVKEAKTDTTVTDSNQTNKLPDLNTLIVLNLIKEIETILDNPNATPIQILDLKNRISAFSNSEFMDAFTADMVKLYTVKLKLPTEKNPDIVIKGSIILEGSELPGNFSMVTITVVDKNNEETVGTYAPNSKTGKYLLILRPDQKYQIIVENDGYQIHMEDLFYQATPENNEIIQVIRLKK